ncbi:hypothetical protein [Sphingomonas sp.]|uniref:hypothetical protein n=1 Tax=Sphingomonas sp. TaxID=28214 RepID=UPI003B001585
MIDLPPPTDQQTIEAIVKCDIPRADVRIRYEDELQSDEITISELGPLNDGKLLCLKAAVHPFYILTITDRAQQSAFYDYSRREDRPAEQRAAQEWVRSKRLTDKVPSFDRSNGVETFAEGLELACGLKPGSTVEVVGASMLTIRRDVIVGSDFGRLGRTLECVMNVFTASDATENGISFGFIGNEAVAVKKN